MQRSLRSVHLRRSSESLRSVVSFATAPAADRHVAHLLRTSRMLHRTTPPLRAQKFPEATSFRICFSSDSSATKRFSLAVYYLTADNSRNSVSCYVKIFDAIAANAKLGVTDPDGIAYTPANLVVTFPFSPQPNPVKSSVGAQPPVYLSLASLSPELMELQRRATQSPSSDMSDPEQQITQQRPAAAPHFRRIL